MAKGFSSVKDAGKDIESRKNAAEGGDFPQRAYFSVKDGKTETVRFLEEHDRVNWAWVHRVDDGSQYGKKVVCRDQDDEGRRIAESCPGCEQDLKREFRGVINLIWRGAGENGEDVVAIWTSGPRVFVDTLDPLNDKYSGLSSRDFEVTRKGTGKNTTYSVFPADPDGGKKPLSAADKKLEVNDLSYYVTAPSYEEWGKKKTKEKNESQLEPSNESPFRRTNS